MAEVSVSDTGTLGKYFILVQEFTVVIPKCDRVVFSPGVLWESLSVIKGIDSEEIEFLQHAKDSSIKIRKETFREDDLSSLEQSQFFLLLPIVSEKDCLAVFRDKCWLREGVELSINNSVLIRGIPNIPEETSGKIRYKGSLHNFGRGTQFGVELDPDFAGQGTSTGSFRKVRYFECDTNCALFVSIFRIRRKPDYVSGLDSHFSENSEISLRSSRSTREAQTTDTNIKINDRIVWLSDIGAVHGTVKWLGHIHDLDPKEKFYAGISFDKAIGKGTGRFRGTQLFTTTRDHASLVPVVGLLKEEHYLARDPVVLPQDRPSLEPPSDVSANISAMIRNTGKMSTQEQPTRMLSGRRSLSSRGLSDTPSTDSTLCLALRSDQPQEMLLPAADGSSRVSIDLRSGGASTETAFKLLPNLSSRDGPPCGMYEPVRLPDKPSDPIQWRHAGTSSLGDDGIHIGDRVQVLDPPRYGWVQWFSEGDPVIVGLLMETEDVDCYTDGTFEGVEVFKCHPHRAFFVHLHSCKRAPKTWNQSQD